MEGETGVPRQRVRLKVDVLHAQHEAVKAVLAQVKDARSHAGDIAALGHEEEVDIEVDADVVTQRVPQREFGAFVLTWWW